MKRHVTIIPADQISEQRTTSGTRADRAERLTWRMRLRYTIVLIIAIGSAFGSGQAIEAAHDAHRLGERVTNDEHASTHSRVVNVRTWCTAINTLQTELNTYVTQAANHAPTVRLPPLDLMQLPCTTIEQRTAASTKGHR